MTGDEIEAEARALILEAARRTDDADAAAVALDIVERFELADADERRAIWDEATAVMRVWLRRH